MLLTAMYSEEEADVTAIKISESASSFEDGTQGKGQLRGICSDRCRAAAEVLRDKRKAFRGYTYP